MQLNTKRGLAIFALIFILLIVFYQPIIRRRKWYEFESTVISKSKEFQLRIYPHYWENRDAAVEDFLGYLESISSLPILSNLKKSLRLQSTLKIKNCFPSDSTADDEAIKVRIRDYIYGPEKGIVSIGAKMSVNEKFNVIRKYNIIEPNPHFESITFQKMEQDIHPCHDNYSRETKLQFNKNSKYTLPNGEKDFILPAIFNCSTCGDVLFFFPRLLDRYPLHLNKRIKYGDPKGWLTFNSGGKFENGISYKMDLTIKYSTINGTFYGNIPPNSGEFSMRIWADEDGFGKFDQELVDRMDHWHDLILAKYGSKGDFPCRYPVDIDTKTYLSRKFELDHLPPASFNLDLDRIVQQIEESMVRKMGLDDDDDADDDESSEDWSNISDFLSSFKGKL